MYRRQEMLRRYICHKIVKNVEYLNIQGSTDSNTTFQIVEIMKNLEQLIEFVEKEKAGLLNKNKAGKN